MGLSLRSTEMTKQELKELTAEWGRRGGKAKVPKGFAKMSKSKRKAISKAAAAKRWKKQ